MHPPPPPPPVFYIHCDYNFGAVVVSMEIHLHKSALTPMASTTVTSLNMGSPPAPLGSPPGGVVVILGRMLDGLLSLYL